MVTELFKSYTLKGALGRLNAIECYVAPGHKLLMGELLEKQKELYEKLGIELTAS